MEQPTDSTSDEVEIKVQESATAQSHPIFKKIYHALHCPKRNMPNANCICIAGTKGLARKKEGLTYVGGDSTRATTRRRRQLAKKSRDW